MKSEKHIKTVLVSLDSMLDTRFGTLILIDPEFAASVTSKETYYTREFDVFGDEESGMLNRDLYKQFYTRYKNDIVRCSMRTEMNKFLFELCNNLIIRAINTPSSGGVEVVINVYPYEFTKIELAAITKSIHNLLKNKFQVSITRISKEDLTCSYVKDNYDMLIMYDYYEWLNIHTKDLKTKILRDTALYVPELNFIRNLNEEEKQLFLANDTDPFEFTTKLLCDYILIQFLPIRVYCVDNKAQFNT